MFLGAKESFTLSASTTHRKYCMTNAINSYLYARNAQKLPPVDACTDAAQFHGVDVHALAAALRAANIDVARLAII